MNINTTANGDFALIETQEEFFLKFGESLLGPFDNTVTEKNRMIAIIDEVGKGHQEK
ncbi:hypothetical protein ACIQYL_20880 [Lysinibacillus xylanilyticus]|uniref:hypothetical protein n=1 Tax=Lysinibacillus xylanilyticus TaxID=582475 RepID=UPI0037FE87C3